MNSFSIDMDFEELKKRWDSIPVEKVSHEEIMKMTRLRNIPRLRKLRNRLFLEMGISLLVVLLIILVVQFRTVSPWITTGLILCNGFYLVNNILGFHYMHVLPHSDTVLENLSKFHMRMKTMLDLSYAAGAMMVSFLIFSDIFLLDDPAERFTFTMFLAPLTYLSFWATDKWRSRTIEVRNLLREFEQ